MTNIISLNQLVELFKNFAQRHEFINDFGYGPTSEIGVSRPMKFPYLWLTIDQNSEIVPQNRTTIPLMGFTVIFMDKTNIQENYQNTNGLASDNRQETLSDTFQYLQDLVTEIDVNWNNYGIKFEGSVSCFPGVDETTDKVNGWVGQFRLRLKHSNCILPTGDIAQTNLTPINPMTRYLTCDTLENCQVIQDLQITKNTRLFSQTGDSQVVSATTVETSIIDGGVGTLSVPPNSFSVGDSFKATIGGVLSNQNNNTIRVRLKSGSTVLADSGVQTLGQHTNDVFKLDVDFTIRNTGTTGNASIITLGTFHTSKKNSGDITGFGFEFINDTTFDTTILNTLDVTVEWGSNNVNNQIKSQVFNLRKTY